MSKAKVLLLAIHLIIEVDLTGFRKLIRANTRILHLDVVLRMLLTALPESTEPAAYTPFLQDLVAGFPTTNHDETVELDDSSICNLTEDEARRQARALHLLPLLHSPGLSDQTTDSLTLFLIHRAHRIDLQTGVLTFLPALILPFLDHSELLRTWFISSVLPLLRLDYEYYPGRDTATALLDFERLGGREGVELLLSHTIDQSHESVSLHGLVGRDLRGLVGPWLYKSRDTRSWSDIYEWLLLTASTQFALAVQVVEQWDGPSDIDLGGYEVTQQMSTDPADTNATLLYAQAALGAIFLASDDSIDAIEGAYRILVKVAALSGVGSPRISLRA